MTPFLCNTWPHLSLTLSGVVRILSSANLQLLYSVGSLQCVCAPWALSYDQRSAEGVCLGLELPEGRGLPFFQAFIPSLPYRMEISSCLSHFPLGSPGLARTSKGETCTPPKVPLAKRGTMPSKFTREPMNFLGFPREHSYSQGCEPSSRKTHRKFSPERDDDVPTVSQIDLTPLP